MKNLKTVTLNKLNYHVQKARFSATLRENKPLDVICEGQTRNRNTPTIVFPFSYYQITATNQLLDLDEVVNTFI